MRKSVDLVREFVNAGFLKIHLDTSMFLADDDRSARLSDETIASRAVALASACENAFAERLERHPDAVAPVYIIGSEVPVPGGTREAEEGVTVTAPEQFSATCEAFKGAFLSAGLSDAFGRVRGVVVQPGVEFGDEGITEYSRGKAKALTDELRRYPGLVFEGHSTDYQTRTKLREMVEDGIAILKVGPALTFNFREAVFALAGIERELALPDASMFREVLDDVMRRHPSNWEKHYHGGESELALKRKYSFSDRCRYYFPHRDVQSALARLIRNINSNRVPSSIVSQYLPTAYARLRESEAEFTAENLIKARIEDRIEDYLYATAAS
jgi:D-tagatose-1,6-bisphosphate aldolase subunit GatZ/KbaZ